MVKVIPLLTPELLGGKRIGGVCEAHCINFVVHFAQIITVCIVH